MSTQQLRDAVEILARVGRESGLDESMARAEGMAVLSSPLSAYEICGRLYAKGVPTGL